MKASGKKKISALIAAVSAAAIAQTVSAEQPAAEITVCPENAVRKISPYIYGVNSGVDLNSVSAKSFRLGGNRLSAYNWENNYSNAGSDYHNSTDLYLVQNVPEEFKKAPGGAALAAADEADKGNVPYRLLTLQMLGYAAAGKRGNVTEEYAAPSEKWVKVENRKGSEFTLEPDKKDGVIYMDEYLNYLFNKIGNSESGTGFSAYALDNEPALWSGTHSMVQRSPLTCSELVSRSKDLASMIKEMDENADVFGPSLYGYAAYDSFQGAPDWGELKDANGYRWFIDYYLDEMSKAEQEYGHRILDVLDLHYYTEAKGECGERSCSNYDNDGCVTARLNSVRSLYDENYRENSWIADAGAEFFPLLPNIEQSIEKYYPGTKLAFTEYNFGGGDHISGGVAEADTLGIFAEHGVYFASIWSFDQNAYQLSAINMFTNYDGMGNGLGDTLIGSSVSGNEDISVYPAVNEGEPDTVRMIVTNRSLHDETPAKISVDSEIGFTSAEVYSLSGDSAEIKRLEDIAEISGNNFEYSLPPLSVTEFVLKREEKKISPLFTAISAAAVAAFVTAAVLLVRKFSKK